MRLPFGNPFAPAQSAPQNQQQQQQQPHNNTNTTLQNGNPGNQPLNQSGTVPTNSQNMQNSQNTQNPQNAQNPQGNGNDPMSDFANLWQNPTNNSQDPNSQTPAKKSYVPQMKPEQLQEILGRMDFTTEFLTPENMQAIQAGGEGATQAMMKIMNGGMRKALGVAFNAQTRLTEQALTNAETGFFEKVPEHVKDQMSLNSLTSKNPMMKDPRFSPVIDAVRRQFAERYPKATPDQIASGVENYFDNWHAELTGLKHKNSQTQTPTNDDKLKVGAQDADWGQWAEEAVGSSIFGEIPPVNGSQNGNTPNQQSQQSNQNSGGTYTF